MLVHQMLQTVLIKFGQKSIAHKIIPNIKQVSSQMASNVQRLAGELEISMFVF